jgi:NTE family protein
MCVRFLGDHIKNIASSFLVMIFLSGCASYGVIANDPLPQQELQYSYSLKNMQNNDTDTRIILSFSGGGTRAAALAYGVMEALRDIPAHEDQENSESLLDEVQVITSVSGGSFTSAYYGLYGDRIFEDFKSDFLLRDINSDIITGALNPLFWFGSTGRTELAIEIYDKYIFHGKTFADMKREDSPLIIINATDLANGIRFSFLQEYFDLLCSDLSTFPVARAVAASSAVPVVFNPVVVETYPDSCRSEVPDFFERLKESEDLGDQIIQALLSFETYIDKKNETQYIHFADGGITDNLGLRAVQEIIIAGGGPKALQKKLNSNNPRQILVISVDAATKGAENINAVKKQPSVSDAISAATDIQIELYNRTTFDLMETGLTEWAKELSTPEEPVTPYFAKIQFSTLRKSKRDSRLFLNINRIPTNFSLSEEQVDNLIQAGRDLLLNNPEFKRFMSDRNDKIS